MQLFHTFNALHEIQKVITVENTIQGVARHCRAIQRSPNGSMTTCAIESTILR